MFGFTDKNMYWMIKRLHIRKFWLVISLQFQKPIKCQAIPTLFDVDSNETLFYQFTVVVNKSGGSCNTIDDPNARVFVPNKVKIWM